MLTTIFITKENRITGYECGSSWWQYGNTLLDFDMSHYPSLAGFQTCEDSLVEAAHTATSWFQCRVHKSRLSMIYRHVAYSPLGYEACFDKHVPCEPDSKKVYDG
ncbi:unnamed protein product [Cercospora beticola]|nr:unnamed protein product [Cercospora beticola]